MYHFKRWMGNDILKKNHKKDRREVARRGVLNYDMEASISSRKTNCSRWSGKGFFG